MSQSQLTSVVELHEDELDVVVGGHSDKSGSNPPSVKLTIHQKGKAIAGDGGTAEVDQNANLTVNF